MAKNVGGSDRAVRTSLGPLLMVLSIASLRGTRGRRSRLALAALAVGAILTATGLTRRCPANSALGRNTYRPPEPSEEAQTIRDRALQ